MAVTSSSPGPVWTVTSSDPRAVVVCHLGRIDYEEAWTLQKHIQNRLIQAKRADPPQRLPHVMLLVEHPPVYTLGRNGNDANLLVSEEALSRHGASFYRIGRGGDITFHGPGQLVGYPLLDLDRFFTDIHRYLRTLEETIIRTCADYSVQGRRIKGRTGVWIGPDEKGVERKICAFGIRCSRWVTMHGFALNVHTDLSYFSHIIPCGIADRGVTSLTQEVGGTVHEATLRDRLVQHFSDLFEAPLLYLEHTAARAFLEAYLEGLDVPEHS